MALSLSISDKREGARMSVQRVTPSKLGKASIRLIWARTHVAIPESVSKGGRADDEGERV